MNILISAYACEHGKGSEPEVGLRTVLAAAQNHEVWVLTRSNNLANLADFLADHPLGRFVHLEGLELSDAALAIKKKAGILGLHWYYDHWQRAAAKRAQQLDRVIDFDVVHHVTFANYWIRAGVSELEKPFVWGPVGGGVNIPPFLLPEVGVSGLTKEAIKALARFCGERRATFRQSQIAASHTFAQNFETARRLDRCRSVEVLPNAFAVDVEAPAKQERRREVAFVARLVPWKACGLAMRSFSLLGDPTVTLRIFGSGPMLRAVRQTAQNLGIEGRVIFEGESPRAEVLAKVAGASVLLHTALREEAGWAVSEALALGVPVVCLDIGGPPVLCSRWSKASSAVVPAATPAQTARRLADAVSALIDDAPPVPSSVLQADVSFRAAIEDAYTKVADVANPTGANGTDRAPEDPQVG